MARTAPAPNIPPIPGMCPSIAVLAGGGDGGGDSGDSAGKGDGDDNAGTNQGGENAEGDSRGAPDYEKYPECGYASHPVDVVTGRAFTHPLVDVNLPGALPFVFARTYSSKMAHRDAGLGFGWAHTLGWEIEVLRRRITVWNGQGTAVDFEPLPVGGETIGPWGWVLRRTTSGYSVDAGDRLWRHFEPITVDGQERHLLRLIEDRNRECIRVAYENGRISEITDSGGRTLRVKSTPEGRIAAIEAKNAVEQGRWIAFATYEYDARGDLTTVRDADGYVATYEYEGDHRMTSDTDRTGLAFHFVYDTQGRCVEAWGDYPSRRDPSLVDDLPKFLADGVTRAKGIHHVKLSYFPEGYTEVADSTHVCRYFGNKHGTLDKRVDGGGVMTCAYDAKGHLISRTDAMGATTHWERDDRGRILKLTQPLGRVTQIKRDPYGLPIEVIDATGGVTRIERDRFGNVEQEIDPSGAVTAYRRHRRSVDVVYADGGVTRIEFDAQWNHVAITEPNGAVWKCTYDALGRRLSEVDPLGAETRYVYSDRGDLVSIRHPNGDLNRYEYDGERRLVRITSRAGRSTELVWGGFQKLCLRKDPNGGTVRMGYDREGQLVEMHNEHGEVHRFEYSPHGKVIAEHTFDGRTFKYKYDRAGRPTQIACAPWKLSVVYDEAGEMVERQFGDDTAQAFEYDARGDLVGAKGPGAELRFERDAMGRIVKEIQSVGGEEIAIEVRYDGVGERIGRSTSLGLTEVIERDLRGERVRTLYDGRHEVTHTRDLRGRELARDLPRGGRLESTFDADGRLVRRRIGQPGTERASRPGEPMWVGTTRSPDVLDKTYRYDADGELMGTTSSARGTTAYTYDPIGQLLSMVPEQARSELFRFDAAGNLYEDGAGSPRREYARGNRLVARGNAAYTWDDAGRLVEKRVYDRDSGVTRVHRYAWNEAGLLASVTGPEGELVELAYDPFARRLQKRVSRPPMAGARPIEVSRTRFVWDGDVLVHEIRTTAAANGDPVVEERTYSFDDSTYEPLAHRDGGAAEGEWYHYVNDPMGTPEELIDERGQVACVIARSAWGIATTDPTSITRTPIRFQGQYADDETGLHYNRFRYYDPEAGRFIAADPIVTAGDVNTFRAPPSFNAWIDPLGLQAQGRAGCNLNPSGVGGVRIVSHGTNDVDRPAHAHVSSPGVRGECRIGPNGNPMPNQRALTPNEQAAIAANLPAIRRELRKVGRAAARLEAEGRLPGANNTGRGGGGG